jgi:hypothetical protein
MELAIWVASILGFRWEVKVESPKALYVHCYAHCLNLVLVDATKSNKTARNFFLEPLNRCIVLFTKVACQHNLFETLQHEFEAASPGGIVSKCVKQYLMYCKPYCNIRLVFTECMVNFISCTVCLSHFQSLQLLMRGASATHHCQKQTSIHNSTRETRKLTDPFYWKWYHSKSKLWIGNRQLCIHGTT